MAAAHELCRSLNFHRGEAGKSRLYRFRDGASTKTVEHPRVQIVRESSVRSTCCNSILDLGNRQSNRFHNFEEYSSLRDIAPMTDECISKEALPQRLTPDNVSGVGSKHIISWQGPNELVT